MERENPSPRTASEGEITFKPVKVEEIPPPSKEVLELMLMWNLRLFPFLLKNYNVIFKKEGHSNPDHKIIHVISSNHCPKSSPCRLRRQ